MLPTAGLEGDLASGLGPQPAGQEARGTQVLLEELL